MKKKFFIVFVMLAIIQATLIIAIDDNPGGIIIEKQTYPDGEPDSFEFSPSYGPNFLLSDDETYNSGPLMSGMYAVSEVNLPPQWNLIAATCDDGSSPSAIDLAPGEIVVCTFTNEKLVIQPGTIIIEKQTYPDGEPDSFEFSPSYGPNFLLSDDETYNSGPLMSGMYAVSEVNLPPQWNLIAATCDDGSSPSAIDLNPGETVLCTFTNEKNQYDIPEFTTLGALAVLAGAFGIRYIKKKK